MEAEEPFGMVLALSPATGSCGVECWRQMVALSSGRGSVNVSGETVSVRFCLRVCSG